MAGPSGDTTHEPTSADTPVHLESLEVGNLKSGERAFTNNNLDQWVLNKASNAPRDGVNVLYTRNSNPLYSALNPATGNPWPGRWIICGCGTPTGLTPS